MTHMAFVHKQWFRYGVIPILCLLILALTTYVTVHILKTTSYMGIRLENTYAYLFDDALDDNSHMNVTIQTKDCTIEATYSGEAYQRVKATEGSDKCKVFNYENGERPTVLDDELVNRDLKRAFNRKPRI
jgi:hypothetical protein